MIAVTLTARVVWDDNKYLARVDGLPLEGEGDTVAHAQDELINAVRAWIEAQDSAGLLETSLSQAGFEGVAEETEVQLAFVD